MNLKYRKNTNCSRKEAVKSTCQRAATIMILLTLVFPYDFDMLFKLAIQYGEARCEIARF